MANVPPVFGDIGKATSDLFGKDFPIGQAKLEINTLTSDGLKFTILGSLDNKTGLIASEIKEKYVDKLRGATITGSWTTNNILGAQFELQDTLAKGLKIDVNTSVLLAKGAKNLKTTLEYRKDYISSRAALDLFKGPTVTGDAVLGSDGFLIGGEASYDVSESKLVKYNAALGYVAREYSIALHSVNSLNNFAFTYFHRVNRDIEAGGRATWVGSLDNSVLIEGGAKYSLDAGAFVKAKIDNRGLLGLGYTQLLRRGVKVSLGGIFDVARFHENVHKLGLSLTFEG